MDILSMAEKFIPGQSQTFSKAPNQFVGGVSPTFLESGLGCHVFDIDGREFIDFSMGLGPIILGYAYPDVNKAVVEQLEKGSIFSLPHPLEAEVAEAIAEVVPSAEMVRFGKNGSDVTSGAVRLARAYTGRDVIACCGYHGWQDWYIATTTMNRGIPKAVKELTVPFEYNNVASLEAIFQKYPDRVAAVIMEPVGVVEPEAGFLLAVKEVSRKHSALLIFDEVITGFRLSLGGAQEYFKVKPDLACFGKALGNGLPISALVGRADIMRLLEEVFFSFTFGGEALSLAAAQATINIMKSENVIEHLWRQGRKLKSAYNNMVAEFDLDKHTGCQGLDPRTIIWFKDGDGAESLLLKSLFQQEAIKRGLLFTGAQNVCFSHTDEDINRTLDIYRECLTIMKQAIVDGKVAERLEGSPVEPVFRKA